MKRFAAALLLAPLAACATTPALPYVAVAGDNTCIVTVAGASYALPDQAPALAVRLADLARRSESALLGPRPARARPGCWDEAVAAVQAAGFSRIGFFSDEPAPPGAREG